MKKTFTLVLITILILTAVLAFAGCGTASDAEDPAASITIAVPNDTTNEARALLLLQDLGYTCIGCTMKLYQNEDAGIPRSHTCCSLDDVEDARSVAYKLGIPYYVFNFTRDFKAKVVDKFVDSYLHGITPNPCIDCNRYLKFARLFERAQILDCDYVVTGHYARIEKEGEKYVLKKVLDETKDQSYVLYDMTQNQLAHTRFPLGSLRKTETRNIALACRFINADKPDSQDICFVPDGDYASIIELHTGKQSPPGDFIDLDGHVLGQHRGIIHYTIGQRKGLGISAPQPLYVCRILPETNQVVLGPDSALFRTEVDVDSFHWISGDPPASSFRCKAKLRYRHPEAWTAVSVSEDGTVHLSFDLPQRAVTPGQAAVLYDGDVVLGGGVIL